MHVARKALQTLRTVLDQRTLPHAIRTQNCSVGRVLLCPLKALTLGHRSAFGGAGSTFRRKFNFLNILFVLLLTRDRSFKFIRYLRIMMLTAIHFIYSLIVGGKIAALNISSGVLRQFVSCLTMLRTAIFVQIHILASLERVGTTLLDFVRRRTWTSTLSPLRYGVKRATILELARC